MMMPIEVSYPITEVSLSIVSVLSMFLNSSGQTIVKNTRKHYHYQAASHECMVVRNTKFQYSLCVASNECITRCAFCYILPFGEDTLPPYTSLQASAWLISTTKKEQLETLKHFTLENNLALPIWISSFFSSESKSFFGVQGASENKRFVSLL